ncbi:MAG: hypothetical protein [Caudoviricetes sp.]|nr:MAG: hypothetical protein [Caudoviricetes sp.]
MRRDLVILPKLESSFLSCEKDMETILRKLFIDSKQYGEELKRLLVLNTKDCLDDLKNKEYAAILKGMSVSKLRELGYIKMEPKIKLEEHAEVKSYMYISFDNFTPNKTNPEFRDCVVSFDIICHTDCWDIGDYRIRPLKIAGYIDGILNNSRLSGIGTFQFAGCNQLILDEIFSGYSLMYQAIHGTDDQIPGE